MGLIDAKAVGALLGLSPRTVYDLASSGRLACYRIRGAVRFDPADVEAFKQSCRVDVRSATPRQTSREGANLSGLLRDPHAELMRYFERQRVKVRPAPVPMTKGNKKGNAGR